MFVPYLADVTMHRWPIANWVLIGLTVLVSFAMFGSLNDWNSPESAVVTISQKGDLQVELAVPEGKLDQMLLQPKHFHMAQLLGHTFLHADIFHLIGNMIFLWVFGNAVNAKLGHVGFLALYFGAAVFEGVVYVIFGPRVAALGASGAIMGIVGSVLILYPLNDIRTFLLLVYRPILFSMSAMWLIAIYMAFDIWGLARHGSGVAYISHVSGAILGILITALLVRSGKVQSDECEENLLQVIGWQPKNESRVPALALAVTPGMITRTVSNPAAAEPYTPPKPLPPLELD